MIEYTYYLTGYFGLARELYNPILSSRRQSSSSYFFRRLNKSSMLGFDAEPFCPAGPDDIGEVVGFAALEPMEVNICCRRARSG